MAEITLNIDSNVGRVNSDMKKLGGTTQKTTSKFQNFSKSITASAGAFFGAAGLIAGVTKIVGEFDSASKQARSFTDAITGLVALGGDINGIKDAVNSLSVETGVMAADVANAMFVIQSGSAGAGKAIQDELLRNSINLSKVWGTDLATSSDALTTMFNIYGKEVGSVTALTNKLNFASIEGKTTFQEIATLLPAVASTAKAFGTDFDDLVATIIAATKEGGNASVTFTGIRNSLAALEEAEKKGIKTSGTLAERFIQLKKAGVPLLEIFGREGLATGQTIISAAQSGALQRSAATSRGQTGDAVASRLKTRMGEDAQFRLAEQLKKDQAIAAANNSRRTAGTQFEIATTRVEAGFAEKGGGSPTLGAISSVLSPAGILQTLSEGFSSIGDLFSESQTVVSQNQQISVNQVKVANATRGN